MDNFAEISKLMLMASECESKVEKLFVLAVEYEAKSITPERFAERTFQILNGHAKLLQEYRAAKQHPPK